MHLKVPPCTRCSKSVGHVMWNTSGDSLTGSHGGHQPEKRDRDSAVAQLESANLLSPGETHVSIVSIATSYEWQGCWRLFLTPTV
jgi:hypothetical protein